LWSPEHIIQPDPEILLFRPSRDPYLMFRQNRTGFFFKEAQSQEPRPAPDDSFWAYWVF